MRYDNGLQSITHKCKTAENQMIDTSGGDSVFGSGKRSPYIKTHSEMVHFAMARLNQSHTKNDARLTVSSPSFSKTLSHTTHM